MEPTSLPQITLKEIGLIHGRKEVLYVLWSFQGDTVDVLVCQQKAERRIIVYTNARIILYANARIILYTNACLSVPGNHYLMETRGKMRQLSMVIDL